MAAALELAAAGLDHVLASKERREVRERPFLRALGGPLRNLQVERQLAEDGVAQCIRGRGPVLRRADHGYDEVHLLLAHLRAGLVDNFACRLLARHERLQIETQLPLMPHEHIVQFNDAQLRAKELDVYHTDGVDVVGPPGLLKLMTTAQLGGRVRRRVHARLALRRLCASAVGPEVDELHMYCAVAALSVHRVARLDVVVDDGRRHGLHETQRLEELHHYPPQRFGAAQGTVPLALHEGIKCLAAELQHEITECSLAVFRL
mmetsp:Transcript_69288/g.215097  ORF Transcript_69288/g.215097 Transcript_69288/m.215097 type:complete len:262 (+) Transcript_69288:278-1063(+)